MATPSLQDILATEPGLADSIDAMTELIPGVPASKENLKTLLEHLMKEGSFDLEGTDETRVLLLVAKCRKKTRIEVQLLGKAEVLRLEHEVYNQRPCVCIQLFECTEDGLLEALLYAKQNRKRYREEGPCPDCDRRSHESDHPKKKLKAKGMPKCEGCMLGAIVM